MAMDEDQKKCGGISAVGVVAIIMSIACIAVGSINIDFDKSEFEDKNISSSCVIESRIPFYLLVAGVINLILIVLRLIFQKCCRKCGEPGEENKFCNSLNFLAKFSCITLFDLLALTAIVVWLVAGTIMTMKVYDEVDYDNKGSSDYCPKYLYRFTFWTCILGWVFVAFAVVFGILAKFCTCFWNIICCKPCKEAEANQA